MKFHTNINPHLRTCRTHSLSSSIYSFELCPFDLHKQRFLRRIQLNVLYFSELSLSLSLSARVCARARERERCCHPAAWNYKSCDVVRRIFHMWLHVYITNSVIDICEDWVTILHICSNLVPIFHMCEHFGTNFLHLWGIGSFSSHLWKLSTNSSHLRKIASVLHFVG